MNCGRKEYKAVDEEGSLNSTDVEDTPTPGNE